MALLGRFLREVAELSDLLQELIALRLRHRLQLGLVLLGEMFIPSCFANAVG